MEPDRLGGLPLGAEGRQYKIILKNIFDFKKTNETFWRSPEIHEMINNTFKFKKILCIIK